MFNDMDNADSVLFLVESTLARLVIFVIKGYFAGITRNSRQSITDIYIYKWYTIRYLYKQKVLRKAPCVLARRATYREIFGWLHKQHGWDIFSGHYLMNRMCTK